MRIVHIVAGELDGGGATKSAFNLHNELVHQGIESYILTNGKWADNDRIIKLKISKADKFLLLLDRIISKIKALLNIYRNNYYYFSDGISRYNVINDILIINPDIIHLHWINGIISTDQIREIKKPIVWTIRDMWPVTGGCHVTIGCERYLIGCGHCPAINSKSPADRSRFNFEQKVKAFSKVMPIATSKYMNELLDKATAIARTSKYIGNAIDCRKYSYQIKKVFDVKRIILISALNWGEDWKGLDYFINSIEYIKYPIFEIWVIGNVDRDKFSRISHVKFYGLISDEIDLIKIYAESDVFVMPSKFETFGKVLAEAMAVGTIGVCFDVSGQGELINHQYTGYKAAPYEPIDLAKGIDWVLSLPLNEYNKIALSGSKSIKDKYDLSMIAKEYIKIYESNKNQ